VSEDTRARVLAAAERLDYKANHVARSLKTRTTRTVAILAPELANDFFMELAEGMEKELEKSGYMLLVSSSSNSAAEEERRLRVLSERLVDGIVVIPAARRGDHLRAVAARGTPVVLVDRLVEGARLDSVLADNSGGAYAATRALLSEGRVRAVFVGGDLALTTAVERLDGFNRAAAESSGVEILEPRLGGMGIEDGYRHMDELLRSAAEPDALFAVNLLVHLGMERRLLEEPPSVYDSLAIASFDETP
jgi:LacI family transcriptional regulator